MDALSGSLIVGYYRTAGPDSPSGRPGTGQDVPSNGEKGVQQDQWEGTRWQEKVLYVH